MQSTYDVRVGVFELSRIHCDIAKAGTRIICKEDYDNIAEDLETVAVALNEAIALMRRQAILDDPYKC